MDISRLVLISTTALGIIFCTSLATPVNAGSAQVKAAQQMLAKLGYDPGEADGSWGGKSRAALNAFQKDQGFKATRNLRKDTSLALDLVGNGAQKVALPMAEKVGKTLIGDGGWRVYYSPSGEKLLRLPNGKVIKAKWHKKDDGTHCEYVFSIKKMDCGDKWESSLIAYKLDGKWTYFEKSGEKKFGITAIEGNKLTP